VYISIFSDLSRKCLKIQKLYTFQVGQQGGGSSGYFENAPLQGTNNQRLQAGGTVMLQYNTIEFDLVLL
jgi:hypothetical protein